MEARSLEKSIQRLGSFNPPLNDKLIDVNFLNYQLSTDIVKRKLHCALPAGCAVTQTIHRLATDTKIHGLQLTASKLRRNFLVADPLEGSSTLYFIDASRSICRVAVGSPAEQSIEATKVLTLPRLSTIPKIDLPEDPTLRVVCSSTSHRYFIASDGLGTLFVLDDNFKILLQEQLLLQHEGGHVAYSIAAVTVTPDDDILLILQYIEETLKIRSLPKGVHKIDFVSGGSAKIVETANELEKKDATVTDAVSGVILQVLRLKPGGPSKYGIASRHYIYSAVTPTEIRWSGDGSHFIVVSSKPFLQVPGDKPENAHPEMMSAERTDGASASTPADGKPDPLARFTTEKDVGPATQTVNRLGGDDEEFAQDETEESVSVWYYSMLNGYPIAEYQRTLGQSQWQCSAFAPLPALHFGLKYDVDCLVYELPLPLAGKTPQELSHVSTFNAFAYVLDSKRNRRLVSFSPTHKYAVCAEINRFVYIYKKEKHGTHKSLCHIEELPGDIAGIMPFDDRLVLLTDNSVFVCYIE